MYPRTLHRACLAWGSGIILLCLSSLSAAHAGTLENGIKEWDPSSIQGTVMVVRGDYIAISEQWVMLLDTSYKGKSVRTSIVDDRGRERSKSTLKKGVLVLARGGLAWDEKLKANVLLATEVQILQKPLNPKDEDDRKRLVGPGKPW